MNWNNRGFTLIEIIIAISLIAIFVTLPALAYSTYLKKARDLRRKTDLNQVGSVLQMYKASKGVYPTDVNELVQDSYLPTIPKDPKDGQPVAGLNGVTYGYKYDSTDGSSYLLTAKLEGEEATGSTTVNADSGEPGYYVVTPNGSETLSGYPTPSVPMPTSTLIYTMNTPIPTGGMGGSPVPTGTTAAGGGSPTTMPTGAPGGSTPTTAPGSFPDLTIENMSRNPAEGYRVYMCNRGTGSSTSTYLLRWLNNNTMQEFTSPASDPYSVPPPNTCEWSGNLTCSLIGSSCSDSISVTATIDISGTVQESDETNNRYIQTY